MVSWQWQCSHYFLLGEKPLPSHLQWQRGCSQDQGPSRPKLLSHFLAHCWRMGDLTTAQTRDKWVTHEKKLNGGELAAGVPELEGCRETGSSGNCPHRNQSGHQRALGDPQLHSGSQQPLLQRLRRVVGRNSLLWLELRSQSHSQLRFAKWEKEQAASLACFINVRACYGRDDAYIFHLQSAFCHGLTHTNRTQLCVVDYRPCSSDGKDSAAQSLLTWHILKGKSGIKT